MTVAPVYVVRSRRLVAGLESSTLRDAPSPFDADVDALPKLTLVGLPRAAVLHVVAISLLVAAISIWAIFGR